jgi:hypothetical protein
MEATMDPNLKVSCRDFAIFQLKLLIDGMKDGMVFTVSFVAFAADLIFKRHGQRRFFYRVLRLSERFDLWLNLHGAAERAETDPDGLFGVSEAGSDTLLGALEQITRGGDEPRGSVERSPPPPRSLEEDYARSRETT